MPVGDTIKLFACWPPLEHNLKLLDEEPPGPERLSHILNRLEGGRCVIVTSKTPLYLSSGCIHAVVTLRGGFMYAGNFMTANNGEAFVRSLRLSPAFVRQYDGPGLRGLMANLLDQVDITLKRLSCWRPMIAELIKSWPTIDRVGQRNEKKVLARQLSEVVKDSWWQKTCAEFCDIDTTRLAEIINEQLNQSARGCQKLHARRFQMPRNCVSSPVIT